MFHWLYCMYQFEFMLISYKLLAWNIGENIGKHCEELFDASYINHACIICMGWWNAKQKKREIQIRIEIRPMHPWDPSQWCIGFEKSEILEWSLNTPTYQYVYKFYIVYLPDVSSSWVSHSHINSYQMSQYGDKFQLYKNVF